MKPEEKIHASWKGALGPLFSSGEMLEAIDLVRKDKKKTGKNVWPKPPQIFRAFEECTADNVKAVIIGQDPYHTPGVANGLSFAISKPPMPPSLRNIHNELKREYGQGFLFDPTLTTWARQGVLLLNRALTVREGEPNTHTKIWAPITAKIIERISHCIERPIVFMLWGNNAQESGNYIHPASENHVPRKVLRTSHPSPFSVDKGFKGCGHFHEANKWLAENRIKDAILWMEYPKYKKS